MTLLRPGRVTLSELACIAPVSLANAVTDRLREGEVALSPGMKYRHYAPESPLVLLDGDLSRVIEYIVSDNKSKIAILCYTDDKDVVVERLPNADIYILGARDDINEQARQLFAILRDADKHSYEIIYAPLPTRDGVGLALYNRMIRAAAHTVINLRQD